ncbi:hypothetical protein BVX94_03185 [bacterium B17]|nr:hypothetical protein BVX94_03185 [bacterium B17]
MNWKIFFSTFVLIFLAELGDKTQLAAMARATTSQSAKWTVFFAASSALILSTLIAVLAGSFLSKHIQPRYLKIAAAIMFIAFGLVILWQLYSPQREAKESSAKPTEIGSFILKMAMEFEKAAFEDYETMAGKSTDPRLKALLHQLAEEEDIHLKQITEYASQPIGEVEGTKITDTQRITLFHDTAKEDRPIIEHAIEHEMATADFYAELASLTPLPALKKAFTTLSKAEQNHAQRLREFAGISETTKGT